MPRHFVFHLLWLLGSAMQAGCGPPPVESLQGTTMGTTYHIRLVHVPPETTPTKIQQHVDRRLAEINRLMSTYDPESELSRFNRSTSTDWFPASPETLKVVTFALETAKESNGKFDPTVGPLVNLWGFGPDKRTGQPPSDEAIAAALKRVGFQHLAVRHDPPALKKDIPDLYVDLSAIAKGYGVDAVAELLAQLGVEAYMVEIGGEVRTRGYKPDGSPWQIGIEQPDSTRQTVRTIVPLVDESLATSGDYRNFFEYQGRQYPHTIDPETGRPVEHHVATATVRAPTCMEADAYATAIVALGPQAGYDWAVERKLPMVLVERTSDGFRERATPQWTAALAKP